MLGWLWKHSNPSYGLIVELCVGVVRLEGEELWGRSWVDGVVDAGVELMVGLVLGFRLVWVWFWM